MAGDVQQQPPTLGGQSSHGQPELRAAVATQRAECVTGEASGVEAGQDTVAIADVSTREEQVQVA
jgi:hypothetical protein